MANIWARPADVERVYATAQAAAEKRQQGDLAGAARELRAGAEKQVHPALGAILQDLADLADHKHRGH